MTALALKPLGQMLLMAERDGLGGRGRPFVSLAESQRD